jgi:hypothetical protein
VPATALNTAVGDPAANAYVDLATANQYFLDRPPGGANAWATATDDAKNQSILWATKLMDAVYQWVGYPTDAVQILLWPRGAMLKRNGWAYVDIHTIPVEIINATAEFAGQLLNADRASDSDIETQGILALHAGPVSLNFKSGVFAKVVPDAVYNLIPPYWGFPRSRSAGMRDLQRA